MRQIREIVIPSLVDNGEGLFILAAIVAMLALVMAVA